MRQYSFDQVELSWQGLDLKDGLASGTSISEGATVPDRWTFTSDARGEQTRSKRTDGSGTLTLIATQAGRLHQSLRALAIADEQDRNIVGPLVLKDLSSGETFTYKATCIATHPDEVRADVTQDFPWVLRFESVSRTIGIPDLNQVG